MEHYWQQLPGPCWFSGADIFARFVATTRSPACAVELGAWKGRSTSCMGVEICNSGKEIEFYAVDHWLGSPGETGYDDQDLDRGDIFSVFTTNIAPVSAYVHPITSDTVSAAERFADGSIDFLYLDASHTYDGVLRDLDAWFRKVKVGGTIAGDDWCNVQQGQTGVRNAVLDFFAGHADGIEVLAGSDPNPDWLQWSVTKTAAMKVPANARLLLRSAWRKVCALPSRFAAKLRSLFSSQ